MRRTGGVVVWWLVAAIAHAGEMPKGYAKPVNGLASRLVSVASEYEEGDNVFLCLDVFNASDNPIPLAFGSALEGWLQLLDDKGRPVRARDRSSGDWRANRNVSPGKQIELSAFYVSGGQSATYEPLKPGRYRAVGALAGDETIQALKKLNLDKVSFVPWHVPTRSQVLVFEVVPRRPEPVVPGSEVADVPWGQAKGGLQTRIVSSRNRSYVGRPLPMKVELRNVGKQTIHYLKPQVSVNGWIDVRDSQGKPVRYVAGSCRTLNPMVPIRPGETAVLDEFDLECAYFLLKPGKYTAQWPGCKAWGSPLGRGKPLEPDIPATNTVSFEIVPAAERNSIGETMTILEEECPRDWAFEHGRWSRVSPRPGPQWSRVPCSSYQFSRYDRCDCGPTTTKGPMHTVSVWLAREKAVEEPWHIDDEKTRPSEYLGETPFGHLYVEAGDPNLSRHWPTAKSDIAQWLKAK